MSSPDPFLRDGPTALLGHTGFVGSNLAAQREFTHRFNSRNIAEMAGRHFALVACAAAPGVKWRANREPEADRAAIDRLVAVLETVTADRVVLISTVDVYPLPRGVDEATEIAADGGHPYGRHRLALERFARDRFDTLVVRLPGLFGPGLRKNVIYDLLTDHALDQINPASTFQFYDLERLWADVAVAAAEGLPLVNFATEPVEVAAIAERAFGRSLPPRDGPAAHYDMRTRHAGCWGRSGPYLASQAEVLEGIARFVARERGGG